VRREEPAIVHGDERREAEAVHHLVQEGLIGDVIEFWYVHIVPPDD
jgi:hypothetical protein